MAFLDELGKVISDKSKEAAGKVKDLTGVLQLKSRLASEKEKVNKAYINLGKAYYDRHDAAAEEDYAEDFELVRTGLMRMAELEDQISELEGNRICADCGAKVDKEAQFCSKCGAQMEEKPVYAEPESGEETDIKTGVEDTLADADNENGENEE